MLTQPLRNLDLSHRPDSNRLHGEQVRASSGDHGRTTARFTPERRKSVGHPVSVSLRISHDRKPDAMLLSQSVVLATLTGFAGGVILFYLLLGRHGVLNPRSAWKPISRWLLQDARDAWSLGWLISKRIGAGLLLVLETGYIVTANLIIAAVMVSVSFLEAAVPEPPKYTERDLRAMSYDTFEAVVGKAWEERGYLIELTGKGPDFGADVIARNGEEKVAIEAKCYSNPKDKVSSPTVQKVNSAAQQRGADRAAVVTSTGFSKPAKEAARSLDVELVNGSQLARELNQAAAAQSGQ